MTESFKIKSLSDQKSDYFLLLYRKYSTPVLKNILRIIKEQEEADDILQNVFIKLFNKQQELNMLNENDIKSWLFKVSYNDSITYLRHQIKVRENLQQVAYLNCTEETNDECNDQIMLQIQEAVKKLPTRKKQVIELCKIQDKTYVEAAAIMGISHHTVKEYLSEALRSIRNFIKRKEVFSFAYFIFLAA